MVSLAVCHRFRDYAEAGRLAVRIDTDGDRFVEGLDSETSRAVLARHGGPEACRHCGERELGWLVGPGVSAAAIFHLRDQLDEAGFYKVRIVASSGFSVEKCRTVGRLDPPVDIVGTGSYLPRDWPDTYATADITAYDGDDRVKAGREFLLLDEH